MEQQARDAPAQPGTHHPAIATPARPPVTSRRPVTQWLPSRGRGRRGAPVQGLGGVGVALHRVSAADAQARREARRQVADGVFKYWSE